MTARPPLLEVEDLAVSFEVRGGRVTAVDGVSFTIEAGETLGIVGESGSGKSATAYALVGLLARNGRVDRGRVQFDGQDLYAEREAMRVVRGRRIAFIFQNPRAALNPIRSIGAQLRDALEASGRANCQHSAVRALELLEQVRIARASERLRAYPHELSGGMCQRVLIAMALAAEPSLLIADEPTTGLDVTTQKVIMDTLYELSATRGLATLLITHDVGLAARYCRRICVMNAGRIVETGPTAHVIEQPKEPYTQRLMAATPRVGRALKDLLPPGDRAPALPDTSARQASQDAAPLLSVTGLSKTFQRSSGGILARWWKRQQAPQADQQDTGVHAVSNVSLALAKGARLGIVGESGSGKTTTARMIARLLDQSAGKVTFDGIDIGAVSSADFSRSTQRHRIQVVFQDPLGSLNPRFTAHKAILNPLSRAEPSLSREAQGQRVREAAQQAGLDATLLDRYPHQLSGGQQARVGIARALVVKPDLLILDEPTSALDVSIQALVLNQLDALQRKLGLSYILVSHDLNVIRLMCDDVLVMRSGKIVEAGAVETVFRSPTHPYTKELIEAVPHLPTRATERAI